MDKTLKTIFVLIILFFGGVVLMNIKNTPEEFEYAEVNCECRERDIEIDQCNQFINKLCDFPVYDDPIDFDYECEECIDSSDEISRLEGEISRLQTELNNWKTDFDKNSLYTMCLKHKRFCKYFNQAL